MKEKRIRGWIKKSIFCATWVAVVFITTLINVKAQKHITIINASEFSSAWLFVVSQFFSIGLLYIASKIARYFLTNKLELPLVFKTWAAPRRHEDIKKLMELLEEGWKKENKRNFLGYVLSLYEAENYYTSKQEFRDLFFSWASATDDDHLCKLIWQSISNEEFKESYEREV